MFGEVRVRYPAVSQGADSDPPALQLLGEPDGAQSILERVLLMSALAKSAEMTGSAGGS